MTKGKPLRFSGGSSFGFPSSFDIRASLFTFARHLDAAGPKKIFHIKFVAIWRKLV